MNQAIKIITDLCTRRWYGKLTISFEGGRITLFTKQETIKPE